MGTISQQQLEFEASHRRHHHYVTAARIILLLSSLRHGNSALIIK